MNPHEDLHDLHTAALRAFEPPVIDEPSRMKAVANKLVASLKAESAKPTPIDLQKMRERLMAAYEQDTDHCLQALPRTDLRYLPWTLVQGSTDQWALSWPGLLGSAIHEMETSGRSSRLTGWIRVYLRHYEAETPEFEQLRRALESQLAQYDGANPHINCWKERLRLLFSANAVELSASLFLAEQRTPEELFAELGLVDELADGGFVAAVVNGVVGKVVSRFPNGLDIALQLLVIDRGDRIQLRTREVAERAISVLIPQAGPTADEAVREPLKSFALRYFRDPRLPGNGANWARIDVSAKGVLARWISHADVEFFFQLVEEAARDRHWKYRKRFWQGYVDHFEATWVALGSRAARLARESRRNKHAIDRSFGRLRDAEQSQSVFIIRMGGYDFVEWSNTGACRVWKGSESPLELGEAEYSRYDLMDENYAHRQIHQQSNRYGWQREMASWIQRHTGIKATQSYRLDSRSR